MNALIGVDVAGASLTAIELFNRLDFADAKVTLLHAVESVLPDGTFPGAMGPGVMADILRETEEAGQKALDVAASRIPGEATKKLARGDAYRSINNVAEEIDADLIAVTSNRKSTLEAFVTGSVTRGLLTGSTQSFLAAKPGFSGTGPLKAVFATDHSEYSMSAAKKLVELAPRGIGEVIIATVLDDKTRRDLVRQAKGTELEDSADVWAEGRLRNENMDIASLFATIIPTRSQVVLSGGINESLRELMQREQADILILGAQGHGFFDRLRSGSVSYHQVVSETYSVLVLRT